MSKPRTISRRRFVTYCGFGAAALAAYSILPAVFTGCSSDTFGMPKFIKLSETLTGFTQESGVLKEELASLYVKSIEDFPPSKTTLQELYTALGLEDGDGKTGNRELTEDQIKLADTVITYWYTGSYKTAEGMVSATYEDMLAWKATEYVTPNAQCHGTMGFWADAPKGGT